MKSNECNVSLTLDREFHREIGVMAHKLGLSYNQFYKNLLVVAYAEAKSLDDKGVLSVLLAGRTFIDEIKEKWRVDGLEYEKT